MANRLLWETDKRLLWKLMWNFGLKGIRSVQKHKSRLKRGEFFPPFLYVSIINSCGQNCCKDQDMSSDAANSSTKSNTLRLRCVSRMTAS